MPSVASSSSAATSTSSPANTVTVAKLVDGDTFHVTMPDGHDEVVRFLGINAPETTKGHHDCYGQQASDYVAQHTQGVPITLTADPSQGDRDRYGRLLRYIDTSTGEDIELSELRLGLAHEYTFRTRYQRVEPYRQAQREAHSEHRGGWAAVTDGGCGWTS